LNLSSVTIGRGYLKKHLINTQWRKVAQMQSSLLVNKGGGVESFLFDNWQRIFEKKTKHMQLLFKIGGGIESLLCDNWPTLGVVAEQPCLNPGDTVLSVTVVEVE